LIELRKEGEQLLSEYRKEYAQEIFDKNLLTAFKNMFEAGYLFKYYQVVWQENQPESEEENTLKIQTDNQSYKQRGTSFRLTAHRGGGEDSPDPLNPKKSNCCS